MLTVFLRNYKLKPFEYDATSLTRLFLGSFSHFSLQSLSSSIKLDVHSHFLISPEIFTWAQVWVWLRHSETFTEWYQSHQDYQQGCLCASLYTSFPRP